MKRDKRQDPTPLKLRRAGTLRMMAAIMILAASPCMAWDYVFTDGTNLVNFIGGTNTIIGGSSDPLALYTNGTRAMQANLDMNAYDIDDVRTLSYGGLYHIDLYNGRFLNDETETIHFVNRTLSGAWTLNGNALADITVTNGLIGSVTGPGMTTEAGAVTFSTNGWMFGGSTVDLGPITKRIDDLDLRVFIGDSRAWNNSYGTELGTISYFTSFTDDIDVASTNNWYFGRLWAIGGTGDLIQWRTAPSYPFASKYVAAVAAGEAVYSFGGYYGTGFTNFAYVLPSSTMVWTAISRVPTSRGMMASAYDGDDTIYLMGGNKGTVDNVCYKYTISSDSYASIAPLPDNRCGTCSGVFLDGFVYFVAGMNASSIGQSTVYRYSPAKNVWTNVAPLPAARGNMTACAAGGKIFACGGILGSTYAAEAWVFDPATGAWTAIASLPNVGGYNSIAVLNNYVYVIGRYISGGYYADVVRHSVATGGAWTTVASLPTNNIATCSAVLNGRIVTIAGQPPSGTTSSDCFITAPQIGSGGALVSTDYPLADPVNRASAYWMTDGTWKLSGDGSNLVYAAYLDGWTNWLSVDSGTNWIPLTNPVPFSAGATNVYGFTVTNLNGSGVMQKTTCASGVLVNVSVWQRCGGEE